MEKPKLKFGPIDRSATRLVFSYPMFEVRVQVQGRGLSKRQRRAMILAIAKRISSAVPWIESGWIVHDDSNFLNQMHEIRRGLSFQQAPDLGSAVGQLGLLIRMRRLELRMTQADLAKLCQMERHEISRIELGQHRPRPETLLKLEDALSFKTPEP